MGWNGFLCPELPDSKTHRAASSEGLALSSPVSSIAWMYRLPMTVRTTDPSHVLSLEEHLTRAAALDDLEVEQIRALAAQLAGRPVLPVLGAGASYDCGMRLATQIGEDLFNDYLADDSFAPHAAGLGPDLGEVADAIFETAGQSAVVRAVGLHDPALWPGTDEVGEHLCAYRVLARLAREGLMEEAITFNYDCGHEAGLKAEGFLRSPRTEYGKEWLDHATVVADAATHAQLQRRGAFTLFKAHGCAERYRELAVANEPAAAETIIIRRLQLTTWRNDLWIRNAFRDRARNHVLLLVGFSGQDPVIYGEIENVLQDIYNSAPPDGIPRVVVIDYEPDTATFRNLIRLGLGGNAAAPGSAGALSPFGERIPLVLGTAWDARTAQLAFVAEADHETSADEWRQLLFAGSALRHHLASDGSAAFGTPVILAVVDDDGRHRLRELAEDLAQRYVIFNRVDLNLVLRSDLSDPDRLDDALAPLLPRCRNALGQEISKKEVQRFWKALEDEVMRAAEGLHSIFSLHREAAGRQAATALVADSATAADLPSLSPLNRLRLRNFRSVGKADIALGPVTIVHGPNGGGKSTLLEGLEIVWAGTSQRKPTGVSADEYARHLPRNGAGEFEVAGNDGEVIAGIAEEAHAELARCVLTHEAVAGLVSQSPEDRYSALLTTTGLEIPDLAARTAALLEHAKKSADQALQKAGMPPLPRRDSQGEHHLRTALRSSFAGRLPSRHDLAGAEEALASASEGTYKPRQWPTDQHAAAALVQVDGLISRLLGGSPDLDSVAPALDEAGSKVRSLAEPLQDAARAVRVLLDAIERLADDSPAAEQDDGAQAEPAALPPDLAARWLAHTKALRDVAARFRSDAESLRDAEWANRLRAYADGLDAAADAAPAEALVPLAQATLVPLPRRPRPQIGDELFLDAGFAAPPAVPEPVIAPLRELLTVLQRQVEALEGLGRELQGHNARGFARDAEAVLEATCRFELARSLRREGPILKASEQLVADLLRGRLAPVVRELVAAIVRFEWYFKPLLIPEAGRKVVLGGLATSDEQLDARLVLNSAERTALGLAWFMALHLLQPAERRRVLVMDDPVSVFDSANQAGFTSTLRAFVRLTRPEQVVVAAHDDAVATVLAEEFAPVEGWPTSVVRLRCQRDAADLSVVTAEWTSEESRSIVDEAKRLRLRDETPAST